MTSTSSYLLRLATVAIVAVGVTALAGCGRKGDPEMPSAATPKVDRPVGIPVGAITPTSAPAKAPKTPFLLDPLL